MTEIEARSRIIQELDSLKNMLLNSRIDPMKTFNNDNAIEQLRGVFDDKFSELKKGKLSKEDTILDLLSYLILLRIAEKQ